MRIFIGIKLDDKVLKEMEKFLEPFKKIASPIKWTKPENIHVTLKFIGEVTPDKYSRIETLLDNADFHTGPIDLNVAGCGKFGKGRDISIFWIGLDKNEKLEDLYNRIENALQKAGIPKEQRKFKPHLTVARNKKNHNFKSFLELIDQNSDRLIAGQRVTGFQVVESRLTPDGPIYTPLKEISIDTA